MSNNVIETQGLTVYYGKHRGIVDLDLKVNKGEVFGFLGPNGAGKTTTLRVLMDIIRPTKGKAKIFGLDCQKQGVKIRERVAYLPGELSLPPNMRGHQFLDMVDALRVERSDSKFRGELCERLNFDASRRIRDYSSGNKQKLGLVASLMGRSELLVLDEATIGLDPLVQQTVLQIIDETRQEGRTIFFCSHILSEVQSVCDRVGIIRDGRLIKVESVDTLTAQPFHRLRMRFEVMPEPGIFVLDGVRELERADNTLVLEVQQNLSTVMELAAPYKILGLETEPITLEEVFLAFYGKNNRRKRSSHGDNGGENA
ncbi:MAG: ABC transporter ATP-binding protein [Anaerolineae bacterium]|nr:MAG: ABC transporter ATP-binding protein [Anaerolineae bacterium]